MKNLSVYLSIPLLMMALSIAGNASATLYLGGSYGGAEYDDLCDSVSGDAGSTCDNSDYGYKVFVGKRVSPNAALELSYIDFGDATATSSISSRKLSVEGFNFSLLGIKPLSKSFEIFGKLGVMFWQADSTVTTVITTNVAVDDTDFNLGLGANYNFSEKFAVRAEYQWFDNLSYESSYETTVQFLTVGVIISFK